MPAMASIPVGTTVALTATGHFSDMTTRDITTQVAWTSTPETVATVSNAMGTAGVVTGVSVGTATVTATAGHGHPGTATITVVAATLQSIAVTPANAMTTALLRSNYKATGTYSNGTTVDLTTQVTWATGNPAIAAISNTAGAQGQLVARTNGTTTVTATLGTVVGTTNVTVVGRVAVSLSISPIAPTVRLGNGNQRFVATEIFSDGTQMNVSGQANWTSSAPAVATINNAQQPRPRHAGRRRDHDHHRDVHGSDRDDHVHGDQRGDHGDQRDADIAADPGRHGGAVRGDGDLLRRHDPERDRGRRPGCRARPACWR